MTVNHGVLGSSPRGGAVESLRKQFRRLLFFYLSAKGNMYCVYILYSARLDRYYTGQTDSLSRRLSEHNDWNNKGSTRGGGLGHCIYQLIVKAGFTLFVLSGGSSK